MVACTPPHTIYALSVTKRLVSHRALGLGLRSQINIPEKARLPVWTVDDHATRKAVNRAGLFLTQSRVCLH